MRPAGSVRSLTLAGTVLLSIALGPSAPLVRSAIAGRADSLLAPSRAALEAGRLAESDSLAARVAALAAAARDSLLWLEALRQQNRTRLDGPRTREPIALALAESSLALGIGLGRDADLAELLRHRGNLLHAQRRLAEAERDFAAARTALLRQPRLDTLLAAQWLVEQSEALYTLGRYPAAVESLQVAVRSLESMARPDTAQLALTLNGLASTRLVMGANAEAESLWWHGLELRRRIRPPLHSDIAQSLGNLAAVRHRRGDFDGAAEFYEQAVDIYERLGGWELPYALDGLAHARTSQGRPLEARRIWERAVDSLDAQGESGSSYALRVARGLAELHGELGDHRAAREQLEAVHAGYLRLFGERHRETASVAALLALQRARDGQIAAALALSRSASRTLDSLLGADNERSVNARGALASLLEISGDTREAEALRRGLLAQALAEQGPDRPGTAWARLALASQLIDRGALDEAEQQVDSAASVLNRLFPPPNPRRARLHRTRARLASARGDREQAVRSALQAVDELRAIERVSAREFSEREAIAAGGMVETSLGEAVRAVSAGAHPQTRVAEVWDRIIEVRMRAFDAAARRRRLATRPDSAMRAHAAALEDARGAFARDWVRAARDTAPPNASRLAALRQRMESAERALAAADPVFAAGAALDTVPGPAVRAAVAPGDALVAYWRHGRGAATAYAAFVNDPAGGVQVFDLGPASRIEAAVELLRLEAGRAPARDDTTAAMRAWRAAEAMTALVWTPLSASLAGARRIHVVPDHALSRTPFTALTAAHGRYWIESGAPLVIRACEREMIAEPERPTHSGALVVGAPAFGDAPARRPVGACVSLADVVFEPLPGAREEAQDVARALAPAAAQVALLAGAQATESAFVAQAPKQRFLHLATHAFVMGESCEGSEAGTRGVGRLVRPAGAGAKWSRAHDRLALEGRAGLAFAGANRREPGSEDGILTSEEIVSLDLGDVECAVLSACETGVGPLASGEGALGLHRAFRIAGARSVVMSLWSLGDRSARGWSLAFWSERATGRPTWEAAWSASRRRLEAGRRGEASAHPFHWAAFSAWAAPGQ